MIIGYGNYYGYCNETLNWLKQLNILPSGKYCYNTDVMIKAFKAAGIWSLLDRFWVFATEQQQHAQIDLKNLSSLTEVSSPSWTIGQGYTGNGSSSYLNTNYSPSINAINYIQNNASFGFYSRTNIDNAKVSMGAIGSGSASAHWESVIFPKDSGSFYPSNNCSGGEDIFTSANSLALFSTSRTTSTTNLGWIRGVSQTSTNTWDVSAPPQNFNFYICANNNIGTANLFDTRQISMAFIGSGSINQLQLYNIFQTFATAQGFSV
jgi:hypothetical protein